jgi:hypothetical protein
MLQQKRGTHYIAQKNNLFVTKLRFITLCHYLVNFILIFLFISEKFPYFGNLYRIWNLLNVVKLKESRAFAFKFLLVAFHRSLFLFFCLKMIILSLHVVYVMKVIFYTVDTCTLWIESLILTFYCRKPIAHCCYC